jgi:hypothetical protein
MLLKENKNMENFTDVKLEIFAPQEYALKIRDELAKIGVGRIGNYDHCVAIYPVQGYYRPLEGQIHLKGRSARSVRGSNTRSKSIAGGSWSMTRSRSSKTFIHMKKL